MKNCPKCNSENIKKNGPFARRIKNDEAQTLLGQMVNYHCENCNNKWQLKFSEDNN